MQDAEKKYYLDLVKKQWKEDKFKYGLCLMVIFLIILSVFYFLPKPKISNVLAENKETILLGGTDDDIAKLEAQKADFQKKYDIILEKVSSTMQASDVLDLAKIEASMKQIDDALVPLYAQKQIDDQKKAKDALIAEAKVAGYKADGSLSDMEKIMNRPEVFGANWKFNADTMWEQSSDKLDLFLDYYQRYK